MKKIFLLLFAAGALFSCQEEFIGQYPVDNIPPKPITNVEQLEQVSGGAMIVKSSMYGTQIKIDGFA